MNGNFIEFTFENIFSKGIPVTDTFFDMDGFSIHLPSIDLLRSDSKIVCRCALELSWVFNMVMNIYHDELNDRNRPKLIELMVREANYYISQDFPKPAVFLSVLNAAEYWFKNNFPQKATILVEEVWGSEILFD